MAEEKTVKTHAANELSQLDKLQNWYEANQKNVNIGLGVVGALVLLLMFYTLYYKPQREMAAQDAIFKAQFWFEQDSIAKSLNDPMNGFLFVANKYPATKAGNLAKYYAGLCYYQLSDFPNAEKFLGKFNPKGDEILGGLAIATLADAQMENGNQDAALKNYKKAANFSENEASAPFLLLKAGLAFDYAGDSEQALEMLNKLNTEFPNSQEAAEAIKYIAKAEASL